MTADHRRALQRCILKYSAIAIFLVGAAFLFPRRADGELKREISLNAEITSYVESLPQIGKARYFLYERIMESGLAYRDFRALTRIIACESGWNEDAFNPKSKDYGYMQINARSWDKKAKELDLEYKTDWRDNLTLGVWIYKQSGIGNWVWSKKCWGKR